MKPLVHQPAKGSLKDRLVRRFFGAQIRELVAGDVADISNSVQLSMLEQLRRGQDSTEEWNWNRFERLKSIRRMYRGEAEWGCIPCSSVVNFNRAFQMAQGLLVLAEDKKAAASELEVVQDFLDYNDLSEERALDLAVEAELNGQVLFRWAWDEKDQQVRLWTVPLIETRYRVEYANAVQLSRVVLSQDGRDQQPIPGDEVVFAKFRSTSNCPYGVPTPMPCRDQMQDMSKAIKDLRQINHLFSSPTPLFLVEESRIKGVQETIARTNWKIGQSFVLAVGESHSLVECTGAGSEYLIKEIQTLSQLISAVTDVPVQFLGYPDLLSNRSTSEDLFEGPVKRAQADQQVWMGAFEELLTKILPLYNQHLGMSLDPAAVAIGFPPIREGNVKDIIAAWSMVRATRDISSRTYLELIGIDDPDEEIRRLAEEEQQRRQERTAVGTAEQQQIQAEIDRMLAGAA